MWSCDSSCRGTSSTTGPSTALTLLPALHLHILCVCVCALYLLQFFSLFWTLNYFQYFWIWVLLRSSLLLLLSFFVSCFTLFCIRSLALTSHQFLFFFCLLSFYIHRLLQPFIFLLFPDVSVLGPQQLFTPWIKDSCESHSDISVLSEDGLPPFQSGLNSSQFWTVFELLGPISFCKIKDAHS